MSAVDPAALPPLRLEPRNPDTARQVAVAALLADPVRAGIIALLRDGPVCVCELAAALEERQNNISNHLARLRDAGLVRATRPVGDARRSYYERDEAACAAAARDLEGLLR
jgi:ArsR family transcriptional regulator